MNWDERHYEVACEARAVLTCALEGEINEAALHLQRLLHSEGCLNDNTYEQARTDLNYSGDPLNFPPLSKTIEDKYVPLLQAAQKIIYNYELGTPIEVDTDLYNQLFDWSRK